MRVRVRQSGLAIAHQESEANEPRRNAPRLRVAQPVYRVLVVDPPWKFGDALGKRGALAKYPCMTLDELKQYRLPYTADDCVLFLWRVATMVRQALDLAEHWGFDPTKGEMVWNKMTPTGKKHFGMGHICRGAHEVALIATRGRPKILRHDVRSTFEAAVPRVDGKIVHSAKPDEFFDTVKSMYDGPRASVFERKRRVGFDCFGNQLA